MAGCGQPAAAPATPVTSAEAPAPPPAPTDVPTATPQPTATPIPTDTPLPTFTPSPLPTNTPSPTATPPPPYPPNVYERLAAQRFYHLEFNVKGEGYSYDVAVDEATPAYHVILTVPYSPPMELYNVSGHYYSNLGGGPFSDNGSQPPIQAGVLEAAEQFAQGWFDHPDAAAFKGVETVNGVRTNHYALTWNAGRQVSLGPLSASTSDPTIGDAWVDAASGAIIKAGFTMRVSGGEQISSSMNVTYLNRPIAITAPPLPKPAASA